ncbi:MAG: hypothetical protein KatS3mg065_1086 [Chloroflexota bacterium]|nr:MAG: hypothetical protein KatS3mg065_1086 [Chloroflexota bacterium]
MIRSDTALRGAEPEDGTAVGPPPTTHHRGRRAAADTGPGADRAPVVFVTAGTASADRFEDGESGHGPPRHRLRRLPLPVLVPRRPLVGGARPGAGHLEYRFLSLEQLNRDPEATEWRIWEQPLDYEHHRGRADRRSLAAFLATAFAEGAGGPPLEPGIVERFRLAIFAARHEERLDIADPEVLERIATSVGLAPGVAGEPLRRPRRRRRRPGPDRGRLGGRPLSVPLLRVPTLVIGDAPPVYLRLANGSRRATRASGSSAGSSSGRRPSPSSSR